MTNAAVATQHRDVKSAFDTSLTRAARESVEWLAAPIPVESPEEARAIAERRLKLYRHVVVWGATCLFFVVTAGWRTATIIGLLWGVFLAPTAFNLIVAPELKRRWLPEPEPAASAPPPSPAPVPSRPEAPASNRAMEELSASIAHEIRNPITAVKSLVQQIGEDPGAAENAEYAQIALAELERVERSISHLLRYARDEALHIAPADLRRIVDSALETIGERVEKAGVRITRCHEGATDLDADEDKLRRVVINLVQNAIDALEAAKTPDPQITIASGQNLAGTELWLRVADNGPGVPAETREKIWKPFYTSKEKGTGLGLAITRKLVEAHGGTIELDPDPRRGVGAELVVTLPRRHA